MNGIENNRQTIVTAENAIPRYYILFPPRTLRLKSQPFPRAFLVPPFPCHQVEHPLPLLKKETTIHRRSYLSKRRGENSEGGEKGRFVFGLDNWNDDLSTCLEAIKVEIYSCRSYDKIRIRGSCRYNSWGGG